MPKKSKHDLDALANLPLTDEEMHSGTWMRFEDLPQEAQAAIRIGRPLSANPKKQVTLRLDAEVLERFKATGAGWQSRINAALRAHVAL